MLALKKIKKIIGGVQWILGYAFESTRWILHDGGFVGHICWPHL